MYSKKHLIIVSVDALVFEDLEYAKSLPSFSQILNSGARIERVKTIYPTLTHPVHASILTGAPAGTTKIVNNLRFAPGDMNAPWFNNLDEIDCETIFHAAHNAGLTTASSTFPMTSFGGEYIDYLVPNVMGRDMMGRESEPLEVYKSLGLTPSLEDIVEAALNKFGSSLNHPIIDEFSTYCAAEIIKRHKPNLLLTHPGYVDFARHRSGVFSDFVHESIRATDRWLSMIFDAVRDAGIEDTTDIVVLGDHGQLNVTRRINTNVYFADKGYITLTPDGDISDWRVYSTSTGLSSYVYLKDRTDKALWQEVYSMLSDMAEEKLYGFDEVLTAEQTRERYGLYGDFSFVLETDGYTAFADDWRRPVVIDFDNSDYRAGSASHGYRPEKGPQPTFIAMGPSFKRGAIVEYGNILNHAPTFARILGVELSSSHGKAVLEILN